MTNQRYKVVKKTDKGPVVLILDMKNRFTCEGNVYKNFEKFHLILQMLAAFAKSHWFLSHTMGKSC